MVRKSAQRWNDKGEVVECEIPEYSQNNLGICTDALMEAVAETSEEFMERYFNGDEFSENEIRQALRVNVAGCQHGSGFHGFQHSCTGYVYLVR